MDGGQPPAMNGQFSSPRPPMMGQVYPPAGGAGQFAPGVPAAMPPFQSQQQQQPSSGYDSMGVRYPSSPGYPPGPPQPPQLHPQQQQQQARRLDPDQMPSAIQVMEDDKRTRSGPFVTNLKGQVPPLVTTPYVTEDHGNAGPRYIRSSMYR